MNPYPKKIVILGGGFGGVYTALYLEKYLKTKDAVEIYLVSQDNYFVFQPMLAEVVGGGLSLLDTISPLRRLLKKTRLYIYEASDVVLEEKKVILNPKFSHTPLEIIYDHLVFALGNVTDFRNQPGLHEHALAFKNLSDAIKIRNHLIDTIEAAAIEKDPELKKALLTYVVGGGGFSGSELIAEVNDFTRRWAKNFPSIHPQEIRVVMIHAKERLMDHELSEELGIYAQNLLKKRGVELILNQKLAHVSPLEAILDNGIKIPSKTIISTVPSSAHPLLEKLNLPKVKGKIETEDTLQVKGSKDLWSLGDCALIPDRNTEKGFCPPTAQFAIRQAKVLAKNLKASLSEKPFSSFRFKALGMMGSLGHHRAVAQLFGKIKLSGLLAWFLWRGIYWWKLPGFDRKLKVAISWLLDFIIPLETVQIGQKPSAGIVHLHFEKEEIIFSEGDKADNVYIILQGTVKLEQSGGGSQTLQKGNFFGEGATIKGNPRPYTAKTLEPVDLLALRKKDLGDIMTNPSVFRELIEKGEKLA